MTCPSVSLHAERCQRETHTTGEHVHRSIDLDALVPGAGTACYERIATWTDSAAKVPGRGGIERLLSRHGVFIDEVTA
jgi:hypothetical protein